jgi:hypothetical protein
MPHTRTWDETAPPGVSTPAATLDTIIQNLKTDVRERARLEHQYNASGGSSVIYDGVHLEGSARALHVALASIPANRSVTPVDGAGGNEEGRIVITSDTGEFQHSDGSTWLTSIKKIVGNLWLTGTFSADGADAFNLAAHAARHHPGATDGVWTTPNDFLPFSLQQIKHSVTLLGGTGVSTTALASQTFGAAGDAKCEVSIDTTGRGGTSRGLLYAEFGWTNSDQDFLTAGLYRASTAGIVGTVGTLLGALIAQDSPFPSGSSGHISVLRYVQGLAATTVHRFALHIEDITSGTKTAPSVQLTYLDLGRE